MNMIQMYLTYISDHIQAKLYNNIVLNLSKAFTRHICLVLKKLCTSANIKAYLKHICPTFLQDKCNNRFVSHLKHLLGGQI